MFLEIARWLAFVFFLVVPVFSFAQTYTSVTYDLNGRVETLTNQYGTHQYTWTWNNCLEKIENIDQGTILVEYFHSHDCSQPVKKIEGGEETLLFYDFHNGQLSAEQTNGVWTTYLRNIQTGDLIATVTNDEVTYVHSDHLGSPVLETNPAGAVVSSRGYAPYGEIIHETGVHSSQTGYTGHPHSIETGLVNAGQRHFNPEIGRFISPDPWEGDLTNPQTLNKYTYALNNPVNVIDPTGEKPEDWFDVALGVATLGLLGGAKQVGDDSDPNYNSYVSAAKDVVGQDRELAAVAIGLSAEVFGNPQRAAGRQVTNITSKQNVPHPTLVPGSFATDSIPARSHLQNFTARERKDIDDIGVRSGCHTCGTNDPGTKSGHFIPDHQPVSHLVPNGTPQKLYPHCIGCSRAQGGAVSKWKPRYETEND